MNSPGACLVRVERVDQSAHLGEEIERGGDLTGSDQVLGWVVAFGLVAELPHAERRRALVAIHAGGDPILETERAHWPSMRDEYPPLNHSMPW